MCPKVGHKVGTSQKTPWFLFLPLFCWRFLGISQGECLLCCSCFGVGECLLCCIECRLFVVCVNKVHISCCLYVYKISMFANCVLSIMYFL